MNQHYVPKCYLEAFADDALETFTVNVEGVKKGYKIKPKKYHVNRICGIANYYNIDNNPTAFFQLNGYDKLFIEQEVFGKRESEFKRIRGKMISGDNVELADLEFFCDFIVLLKLRNPFWEKFFVKNQVPKIINQSFVEEITDELDQKELYQNIPPQWKKAVITMLVDEMKKDITVQNTLRLNSLINRNENENPSTLHFRTTLLKSAWVIWKIDDSTKDCFITSDNPGFAIDTKTSTLHNSKFSNGFKYLLPLTPKHCLEISDSYKRSAQELIVLRAPPEVIKLSNLASLNFINEYIIGKETKELNEAIMFIKANLAAAQRT